MRNWGNYPPGVTGSEWQIVGDDRDMEYEDYDDDMPSEKQLQNWAIHNDHADGADDEPDEHPEDDYAYRDNEPGRYADALPLDPGPEPEDASNPGFYFGEYRVWIDGEQAWLERGRDVLPIYLGDVYQVIELLVRVMNGFKRSASAQVRSTEE